MFSNSTAARYTLFAVCVSVLVQIEEYVIEVGEKICSLSVIWMNQN